MLFTEHIAEDKRLKQTLLHVMVSVTNCDTISWKTSVYSILVNTQYNYGIRYFVSLGSYLLLGMAKILPFFILELKDENMDSKFNNEIFL